MTCPKCNGAMRTFDRLGIHVEQCEKCRGIFLDYGELEEIVAAEQQYSAAPPPPLDYRGRPPAQPPYGGRPDSPSPYGRGRGGYSDSPRPYGKRRRGSIFEQLFD